MPGPPPPYACCKKGKAMLRAIIFTLALFAVTGGALTVAQRNRAEARMLEAAKAFLATLDAAQKSKISFPFNSEERLNWHFVPRERKGLPFKEMNEAQRKAGLELLRAGLSAQGYTKAETIRKLEDILRELEAGRGPARDPELDYFTLFGTPAEGQTWGWRYEGHHISQNWSMVNGKGIASSPQFFGSNPGEVRDGPMKGTRALAAEEDLGRALAKSLSEAQRPEGIIASQAPRDILSTNSRQAPAQEDKGIAYAKLTREQQGMLLAIIEEYAAVQPRPVAEARLAKIRQSGLDGIKFAWMGSLEKGQGHYYRVQGPSFLIEYDNTQNNANHIHCVWRDFKGDFGLDLLAAHYLGDPHHADYRAAHPQHAHGGHGHHHPHAEAE